jgi:hypothetical protein
VQNAIAGLLVPSNWRRRLQDRLAVAEHGSDAGYDSDEGEELGDVDHSTRNALEQSVIHTVDDTRRLSRELVYIAPRGVGR